MTDLSSHDPISCLKPLAISYSTPFLPLARFLSLGSRQEAHFQGRSQARSREWRSRKSQGVLQAFCRGQETCSQETQGSYRRKKGHCGQEGCTQEKGKMDILLYDSCDVSIRRLAHPGLPTSRCDLFECQDTATKKAVTTTKVRTYMQSLTISQER
jgi:hypothetical protein